MIEFTNLTNSNIKEDDINLIKEVMNYAMNLENAVNSQVNVIIVDNDYIHKINKEYRGIDRETDVISFALEDETSMKLPDDIRILGDIYISIDKVLEQAQSYNHSNLRELAFLCVHGLFHLLGYDHQTKDEEEVMFKKQEEVLEKYGITR